MNRPTEPTEDSLRSLLRSARPDPALPPRFQEGVWRRIEQGDAPKAAPALARWEAFLERLLFPRFALASLALLLVAGGLTGVLTSGDAARHQAQERYLSIVAPNPIR